MSTERDEPERFNDPNREAVGQPPAGQPADGDDDTETSIETERETETEREIHRTTGDDNEDE